MNPREYQKLAQRLAAAGDAVELRTATSRAYYAVYNVAAEFLNHLVPLSRGAASHGQVQKLLANCGNATIMEVGRNLREMHARRLDADYDMADVRAEDQTMVQATVVKAGDMIDKIDAAFTGSASRVLKKAIQEYWTLILREPLRGRKPIA